MGHRRRKSQSLTTHVCETRSDHLPLRSAASHSQSQREGRQGPGRVFLACDAQGVFAAAVGLGFAARTGSSRRNVEPLPTLDSTQMRPPCISTICLAMARPRPVPPLALVLELST